MNEKEQARVIWGTIYEKLQFSGSLSMRGLAYFLVVS